jgi:dienelactone hydrolase
VSADRIAVVIAHEILGRNAHIGRMKNRFGRYHCDVHTPDLFDDPARYFRPGEQSAAYEHFMKKGGAVAMAARLSEFARTLRPRYRKIYVLGFSAGATSAWIAASEGAFDAAVCFYGSRIRDHTDLVAACPCLLLFAATEPSFSPGRMIDRLAGRKNVTTGLYDCGHGFCDLDSPNHDPEAAESALTRAAGFLNLTRRATV